MIIWAIRDLLKQRHLSPESDVEAPDQDVACDWSVSKILDCDWSLAEVGGDAGQAPGAGHALPRDAGVGDEGEVVALLRQGEVGRHVGVILVGVRDHVGELVVHGEQAQLRQLKTSNIY